MDHSRNTFRCNVFCKRLLKVMYLLNSFDILIYRRKSKIITRYYRGFLQEKLPKIRPGFSMRICTIFVRHVSSYTTLFRNKRFMLGSSKMLQYLPYFWNTKTHIVFFVFSFCAALFSPLMNALVYVKIDQGIH